MEDVVALITNQGLAVALVIGGGMWIKTFITRIMDENKAREQEFFKQLGDITNAIDKLTDKIGGE